MTKDEFHNYLEAKGDINADMEELRDLATNFPYSSTIQMVYAKSLHQMNSIHYENQLQNASLVSPDRRKLYQLIMTPWEEVSSDNELELTEESDIDVPVEDIQAETTQTEVATDEVEAKEETQLHVRRPVQRQLKTHFLSVCNALGASKNLPTPGGGRAHRRRSSPSTMSQP